MTGNQKVRTEVLFGPISSIMLWSFIAVGQIIREGIQTNVNGQTDGWTSPTHFTRLSNRQIVDEKPGHQTESEWGKIISSTTYRCKVSSKWLIRTVLNCRWEYGKRWICRLSPQYKLTFPLHSDPRPNYQQSETSGRDFLETSTKEFVPRISRQICSNNCFYGLNLFHQDMSVDGLVEARWMSFCGLLQN